MNNRRYIDLTTHITALGLYIKSAMELMNNQPLEQALGWFIFACMYMVMEPPQEINRTRLVTNTLGVVAAVLLLVT